MSLRTVNSSGAGGIQGDPIDHPPLSGVRVACASAWPGPNRACPERLPCALVRVPADRPRVDPYAGTSRAAVRALNASAHSPCRMRAGTAPGV